MNALQQSRATALFEIRHASLYQDAALWSEDRFICQTSAWASLEKWRDVTPKQHAYLAKLCWKYREQLIARGNQSLVPADNPYEKATV